MSLTRIATFFGAFVLVLFVVAVLVASPFGLTTGTFTAIALVGLIAAGSMLYGRRSHYGAAAARSSLAQEAHNHAADLAADARRATAEAAKRGERYCPLDPGNEAATNGHASAHHPAPPPSQQA